MGCGHAGFLSQTAAVRWVGELNLDLGNLGRANIAATHRRDLFGTCHVG